MNGSQQRRVLIVGAGSMGIILGYYLSLAGASITFLVRPHRTEQLKQPQTLYSYGDRQLKTFSNFIVITNPSEIAGVEYDYILITLDAASLRNTIGQDLVKTIGEAVLGTETGVIVGAVFPELKSWFLSVSGLPSEQVVIATLYIHIYPVKRLTMSTSPPTDPDLLAQAVFGYTDCLSPSLVIEESSPTIANGFASLYDANGVSKCALVTPKQNALGMFPFFAVLAACELMDWPKFADINCDDQSWSLAIAAYKEIQGLAAHGEEGQVAAQATTADGVKELLAGMENTVLPFELQTFNRFHHGSKVNAQDRQILRACLASGIAEGKPMTALEELLHKVETHRAQASS